ncbi:MAG: hypothetical protein PHW65_00005, partial [Dehalococcoidales bacterium]|nr:hypothetical protein [Dehalococcoidales bacterium]
YGWGDHSSAGYLTATSGIYATLTIGDRSKLTTNLSDMTSTYTGSASSIAYTGYCGVVRGRTYECGLYKQNAWGTGTITLGSFSMTATAAGYASNYFSASANATQMIVRLDGDGSSKSDVWSVYVKQITNGYFNVADDIRIGGDIYLGQSNSIYFPTHSLSEIDILNWNGQSNSLRNAIGAVQTNVNTLSNYVGSTFALQTDYEATSNLVDDVKAVADGLNARSSVWERVTTADYPATSNDVDNLELATNSLNTALAGKVDLAGGVMTGYLTNETGFVGNGAGLTNVPASEITEVDPVWTNVQANYDAATNDLSGRMISVESNTGTWNTASADASTATNAIAQQALTNAMFDAQIGSNTAFTAAQQLTNAMFDAQIGSNTAFGVAQGLTNADFEARKVSTNDAAYLSIPLSMTNYVHTDSSTNWLSYDPATRLFSGCVTNQGNIGIDTNSNFVMAEGTTGSFAGLIVRGEFWMTNSASAGVPESVEPMVDATSDGNYYARKDAAWADIDLDGIQASTNALQTQVTVLQGATGALNTAVGEKVPLAGAEMTGLLTNLVGFVGNGVGLTNVSAIVNYGVKDTTA